MNALSCLIEEHQTKRIPTGSYKLDQALQTGNRLGTLTEINGSSGAGKTQLCLQLTINCILPEPVGEVGGEVVFISTKRNFCQQRVHQLVDRMLVNKWESSEFFKSKKNRIIFTRQEALKKIYHRLVTNLPELIATIYQLNKFVGKRQTVRICNAWSDSLELNFFGFFVDPTCSRRLVLSVPPWPWSNGKDSNKLRAITCASSYGNKLRMCGCVDERLDDSNFSFNAVQRFSEASNPQTRTCRCFPPPHPAANSFI